MRSRGLKQLLLMFACGLALHPAFAGPRPGDDSVAPTSVLEIALQQGDVYMLRGFADVFSRGLDQMAQTLKARGVHAEVTSHTSWRTVLRAILQDRRRSGVRPIVLVGHSLGANAVIRIAEELKRKGISVQYLVTLAATGPDPVPSNVQRADNFFFRTNGWGEPLVPAKDFTGHLRNLDFSKVEGFGHFNIDKQPAVQRELLANIEYYSRGAVAAAGSK